MEIFSRYSNYQTGQDKDNKRFYGPPENVWTYPSVSTVVKETEATPEFVLKWAIRLGQQGYDDHMAMTSEFGTKCHEFFDLVLQGKAFEVGEPYARHVAAFREWVEKHKVRLLASEFVVVSQRYGFAGRVDALCEVDGKVELLDWKTGTKYRDSWATQIGGYSLAFKEMLRQGEGNPFTDLDLGLRIVHVARDTGKLKDFKFEHTDFIEDSFLLALDRFKRAPNFSYLRKLGWKYVMEKAMVRNLTEL